MESTVIGVYDNYGQAQNAVNALVQAGFGRKDIQLTPDDETSQTRQSAFRATPQGGERAQTDDDTGESTIGQFFGKIFGTYANTNDKANHGDVMSDAELFSEAVRRGSYLLAVQARNDEQHDEIVNIMDRFEPIDIDERGAHWRMQGWSKYDSNAPVLNDDEVARDRSLYTNRPASTSVGAAQTGMPQEASSLQTQGNQTDAANYTQTGIGQYDTTGINRERKGVRIYPRSDAGSTLSNAGTASAAGGFGAASGMDTATTGTTMGGAGGFGDDNDYRSHWQSNYGHLGGSYEDHATAYQYGSRLAGDERYRTYDQWNDVETNARTDWESQNAGHPWEKAKDAVRYSWEKVTNKGRQ